MTPKKDASSPCSSTFTLQTFTLSPCSSAISEMVGESMRQGPHQGAQKSIRTGLSEFMTSASKFSLVMFISVIFTSLIFILVYTYILPNVRPLICD